MIFQEFTPANAGFSRRKSHPQQQSLVRRTQSRLPQACHRAVLSFDRASGADMLEIDPQFVVTPYKVLSRVRRDNRFTKNKDLYRDHLWLTFRHPKKHLSDSLCYYFEIEQEGWGYGVGYYHIPTDVRDEFRRMILHHDMRYQQARQALEQTPAFSLYGDCYKRPPFPDAPESEQTWLNRKNIGVSYFCDDHTALFGRLIL